MKKIVIFTVMLILVNAYLMAGKFEKEFTVKPGKKLTVDLDIGGSIEVRGWEKSTVNITINYSGREFDSDAVDFRQDDSGIYVNVNNGNYYRNKGLEISAQVPEKFDLDLETMGGSIKISNVEGEINGKTMGGSLVLDNLKGTAKMITMGGEIVLKNAELDGQLKTMGGEVLFEDVVGNIEGISMGGDITFRNVRIKEGTPRWHGGVVKISSMGGEIKVDDAPMGADVHTMGGEIYIKNANIFVKAKTMGGEINIERIDGWINATTMGGDVTAVMVGDPAQGKRDVDISSKGGTIDLTLPAGISADFDIRLDYTRESSRNFKIESDFDIRIEDSGDWIYDQGSPRKYIKGKGKINGGKHQIRIRTINGDIIIRKGEK